jgi:hypothetical protein
MAPVQNPTYMLAPNWTFRSGGAIALGNIVADPFKPHVVLSRAGDASRLPETETIVERDWSLAVGKRRSVAAGVWASFLQSAGAGLGGSRSREASAAYATDVLETVRFRDGGGSGGVDAASWARDRVAHDPVIAALMRPESLLSKPVYMITGLKIAKNFRLTSGDASATEAYASLAVPVDGAGAVGVGGRGAVSTGSSSAYAFRAEDVVFAYQLHRIAPKGWRKGHKKIEVTEYQSSATFLGDDDDDDDEEVLDIDERPFTSFDIADLEAQPDGLRETKQMYDEDEYVVLSASS